MSRIVTKQTKWHVRRAKTQISLGIRPVAQADLSLRCALKELLRTQAFFKWTAKTLIRLCGCPGWSESSLGAHAILLVLSRCGSYYMYSEDPFRTRCRSAKTEYILLMWRVWSKKWLIVQNTMYHSEYKDVSCFFFFFFLFFFFFFINGYL